ncbi:MULTISPECIES: hypothetical protein [unclassified Pseudofrankia]|uniref:hypothetical protein n=1 Tax=unclassified Pseudofrankia TaxID=2994372 RepID=UPI0009F212A5|nr:MULTISPECIES: hypothetical protein [unclassified Pseudofrankia]MDT3440288.1 hypothetical protein [Pseudofrankia sp. BMG5.37]
MDATTSRPDADQISATAGAGSGGGAVGAIVVPARFNGPPGSANGGWISGTLAGYLDDAGTDTAPGRVAEAVLRAPTPLEVPLAVEPADDGGVRLVRGGTVLVEAHAAESTDLGDSPPFIELDEAERAAAALFATSTHPFPGCFGCGTGRPVGDGLRILPGQVAGGPPGLVATAWTVDHSLAEADGTVGRHLLWSALDCPSFWAHQATMPTDGLAALLARQAVSATGTVTPGETYVVVARADAADGRKLRASSALYTADGRLLASSTSLWIRIQSVPRP